MLEVSLVGDTEVIARFASMPGRLQRSLVRTVTRLGLQLQRKVKSEKLSGQVLKVRSGLLRSSINLDVRESASGVTASVGTNVQYGRAHEYGATIPAHTILPKSARALAFEWKGQQRFFAKVNIPAIHLPERSFLRSALREMEPIIKTEVEATVSQEAQRAT